MTGLLTERLRQAAGNAVAMWTALARARGDAVVEHPAFTAIDGRRFRIMLRTATPGEAEIAELTELARARKNSGRVVTPAELATVEDIVVHGFPLEEYQPLEPGTVFPPALLAQAGPAFFTRGAAGACLTMAHGGVGGAYWVTTLPAYRSKGVGRALMHAVLRHFDDLPVTLTAARAGKPLYDKLGFVDLGDANWWR